MFSKKTISALLLLTAALLGSCQKDQDPNPAPAAAASMECKLNNGSWKAISFDNTLIQLSTGMYPGKRLDIRGTASDGTMIILTVSEPSTSGGGIKPDTYYINVFKNLPPNYQSGTPAKGALGTYLVASSQKFYMSDLEAPDGQIVITACDATKKTVSGTFFFEATDLDDEARVNITSGAFTNLSYK